MDGGAGGFDGLDGGTGGFDGLDASGMEDWDGLDGLMVEDGGGGGTVDGLPLGGFDGSPMVELGC